MNISTVPPNCKLGYPPPGTVISTPLVFGLHHLGIVSDRYVNGEPLVISGSKRMGQVVEEPLSVFCVGGVWNLVDFQGPISGMEVVQRARSVLGTRYQLLSWNCEHVVHFALGMTPKSPQLHKTVLAIGITYMAMAS